MKSFKDAEPFTVVLDDALSNCFIYNPKAPDNDPQIEITIYDRTEEQNDDLGLNDMNCWSIDNLIKLIKLYGQVI